MFVASFAKAQSASKRDTLYYLLDVKKKPAGDCMLTVVPQPPYVHYIINCPDLKGDKPSLRGTIAKKTVIGKESVRKISFLAMPDLMDKIKAQPYYEFKWHYVLFFIEPTKTGFTQSKVYLDDVARGPSNDLHTDTVPPRVRRQN